MLSVKEIKKKKVSGDYGLVGKILSISADGVRKHLNRPSSKRLADICAAFTKVINAREKLIN